MKRFFLTLLLILGLGIVANAQDTGFAEKADKLALELTQAVNEMSQLNIDFDEYEKKCTAIGLKMGLHLVELSDEDQKAYLDKFINSLYYYSAEYGIDKETADMLVESFYKAWTGSEDTRTQAQDDTPISSVADSYARQIASYIEEMIEGADKNKELENVGMQMGNYLTTLSKEEVVTYRDEFYKSLEFYILKIEYVDEESCEILMDTFRKELDKVFDVFY